MNLIDLTAENAEIAAILDERATMIAKLYVLLVNTNEKLIHLRKLESDKLPMKRETLDNLTERFDVISAGILGKKANLEEIKQILEAAENELIAGAKRTGKRRIKKSK